LRDKDIKPTTNNTHEDVEQGIVPALQERAEAYASFRHTVIPKRNRHRFLMAAAAIGLMGLIAMPKDSKTPKEPAESEAQLVAAPVMDLSRLKSGDNLGPLLQRNGLSGQQAHRVTQAFRDVFKPQNLRAGQAFDLHFAGDTLEHLTFKPNVGSTVFIDRDGENYTARQIEAEFKYETIGVKAMQHVSVRQIKSLSNLQIFMNIPSIFNATSNLVTPLKCFLKSRAIKKAISLKPATCSTHLFLRAEKYLNIGYSKTQKAARISMMQKVKPRSASCAQHP